MKIALSMLALAACSTPALSCSCMRGPNAPRPPIIVVAKVRDVRAFENDVHAALRVRNVLRGKVGRSVVVRTPNNSAACGVAFERGARLRLGFSVHDGMYSANLCQQINLGGAR